MYPDEASDCYLALHVGRSHFIVLLVGSAGLAASNVLEAAFRGLGQTRVALSVTVTTVVGECNKTTVLIVETQGASRNLC